MSEFQERQALKSMYGICKKQARNRYGSFIDYVSPTIFRALVADEILHLLYAQDDTIAAETVRKLVNGLSEMLNDDKELN